MESHADPAPFNPADASRSDAWAERDYPDWVRQRLAEAVRDAASRLNQPTREIQEQKRYLWESRSDMDHAEKASSREFPRALDAYATHLEASRFQVEDAWIARRLMPAWLLEELFPKHRSLAMTERVTQVLPDAAAASYHSPMDRHLLYVACTRAMHRLVLTHTGEVSPFPHSQ